MEANKKQGKHFVLVHGAGHGAWCWYKLKPLLEAAGHKVTALDLAASGIDLRKIEQLHTLHDYTLPLLELMESLPQEEKAILVGHSLGGMNLALAMEKYPKKIYAAVFLAAFMPDSIHISSYVMDQDVALGLSLVRTSSLFLEDLSKAKYLTDEGYGSVKRVYVVCTEDKGISKEFQQWQIDNIGVTEAKEIKGADHMAMLCMPKKLCDTLVEIADKYN
ncbi:salicylic acid-binding protein 2 isoform X2 [Solanum lycopersicum]|uniref:salicylic acid-binding protein 2 isoform X2 n=1 Tax=Solanum lycopersicum TaxID=4081 RepID=UPI0002BC80C7|nr:salicylic acid-binding protein 2 isoform X2 [Solanum lycopersicum]